MDRSEGAMDPGTASGRPSFLSRMKCVLAFVSAATGEGGMRPRPVDFLASLLEVTQMAAEGKVLNDLINDKFKGLSSCCPTARRYGYLHTVKPSTFRKHLTVLHVVHAVYCNDGSTEKLSDSDEPLWRYVAEVESALKTFEDCEKWFRQKRKRQLAAAAAAAAAAAGPEAAAAPASGASSSSSSSSNAPPDHNRIHNEPTPQAVSDAPAAGDDPALASDEGASGAAGHAAPLDPRPTTTTTTIGEDQTNRIQLPRPPSSLAPGHAETPPLSPRDHHGTARTGPLEETAVAAAAAATTTTTTTPAQRDRTGTESRPVIRSEREKSPIAAGGVPGGGRPHDVAGDANEENGANGFAGAVDLLGADEMSVARDSRELVEEPEARGSDGTAVESESPTEPAATLCCDVILFDDEDEDAAANPSPRKRRRRTKCPPCGKPPTFRECRDQVVKVLLSDSARKRLPKLATDPSLDENCSCMHISTGRFELFLEAARRGAFKKLMQKSRTAWLASKGVDADWIAEQLMATMDEYVLQKDQAMEQLKKRQGGVEYKGEVYSLIVSYDQVKAQPVHIDCVYPDYLGAMMLTQGPKTVVYPVYEEMGIPAGAMTCDEFAKLVCDATGVGSTDRKDDLSQEFANCEEVPQLIQDYGSLLASWKVRARARARLLASKPVLADTSPCYIGMVGSTCHCGPACDQSRVVLFSTYKKLGAKGYSGLTQYHAGSLLGTVILHLAPEASQATLDLLLLLFTAIVASDPSLGAFLDDLLVPKEPSKESEALLRLKRIKSLSESMQVVVA